MAKDTFYLYKSDKKDKKFKMVMGEPYNHKHYFGSSSYRDYVLINDKNSQYYIADENEREKVKKAYRARHKNDNIKSVHSAGGMSWYILWSAKTLSQGIKNYEKAFNVKVIYKK